MKSLFETFFVVFLAVVVAVGFSMVSFAHERMGSVGNQQTAMSEKQMTMPGKQMEHQELGKMETATGKVTSVDPGGMAITISENIGGKGALDVGTIVDKDTLVKIKGKDATLGDIKVGDTVTVKYLKSNDLYAKEIVEK